ncbi:aldo/keto reductase [Sphingomonas canadensis]|uniref:Aldo/keto reductase n=1 Tax=Sphingomonas canadensis TaxID=1219257 RepID=A0ABW3H7S2_9SPHN|nr:aldo/keto reductase [Sphingomonas canadensis]MCW3836986.1 aldo/keto reductase [Sphingomonas canadensis]
MRYKLFGRTGLRVSEVALGTGTFGQTWGWGADFETSKLLFDRFVDAGGNLFDCADGYQNGEAETYLGKLIARDRDAFAVSTKYTTAGGAKALLKTGNSRKAMMHGIEGSLRRLGTDYVDIFWVHLSDLVTPMEEILRGLDDVVRSGKARYAGISDFPAWRISRGAAIAEMRGWTPVSAVQIEYSLAERSAEREFLPMAQALGMAVAVWSPLGGGLLSGKYRRGEEGRRQRGGGAVRAISPEREDALLDAVEAVAAQTGATPAQVAIAWVRSRELPGSPLIPILGARTAEQLEENLGAVALRLDAEQLAALDAASAIVLGFPHDLLAGAGMRALHSAGQWGQIDLPPQPAA